jgi:hypothetical protein
VTWVVEVYDEVQGKAVIVVGPFYREDHAQAERQRLEGRGWTIGEPHLVPSVFRLASPGAALLAYPTRIPPKRIR